MRNRLFVIGRMRSRERELLSAEQWQQLSAPANLPDWFLKLRDTAYAPFTVDAGNYEQLEQALGRKMADLKKELFAGELSFTELLWRKYDLHNLKICLKMKLSGKDLRRYLLSLGDWPLSELEKYLKDEKTNLPEDFNIWSAQALVINRAQGLMAMDIYLDSQYFLWLRPICRKWGVMDYARKQIDLANIKLWWYQRKSSQQLAYLPGGNIGQELFQAETSPEKILSRLTRGHKSTVRSEAELQKILDDELSGFLFSKRYTNYGIWPFLVYWQALELEVMNLKTCYLRQAKGLAQLTDYLRYTYA